METHNIKIEQTEADFKELFIILVTVHMAESGDSQSHDEYLIITLGNAGVYYHFITQLIKGWSD